MRSIRVLDVGLIGLAGMMAGCDREVTAIDGIDGTRQVVVTVRCPSATELSIGADPPSVMVLRNNSVEWSLQGDATDFEINPKQTGRNGWPFTNPPPHRGTKDSSASTGNANSDAEPGTYQYGVTAMCQVPNGGPLIQVTIDPDVIITL